MGAFSNALMRAVGWVDAFRSDQRSALRAAKALQIASPSLVPIGAVIWWHKSLTGTPALPDGWVECNGQVLDDPDSVYDGLFMPDINVDGRFIRGNATSGTEQAQDTLMPSHTHDMTHAHDVNRTNATLGGATSATFGVIDTSSTITVQADLIRNSIANTGAASAGAETRPINISMVAIMRVK